MVGNLVSFEIKIYALVFKIIIVCCEWACYLKGCFSNKSSDEDCGCAALCNIEGEN